MTGTIAADPRLARMFRPLAIKAMTLPNRFVMPAMQRGWSKGGVPDDRLVDYYRARALGGVGLIIGESAAIDHPSATGQDAAVTLHGAAVPAWARIVDAVKQAGGHMLLQLWHEGAMRLEDSGGPAPGAATLSPSGLIWAGRANGRAATRGDLDEILDAYARTAATAKRIGADGVEVHGAHGFLLDQFCWNETNIRDDGFGDGIAARFAFPAEVVRAIRAEVGEDFVIGWRFSQWKEVDFAARVFADPGELEQSLGILRAAGVDLFHASTRRFWEPEWPGSDLGVAGWASALTDAPVIGIGSIGVRGTMFGSSPADEAIDPRTRFEELLRRFDRGDFALMAVGRALIADPDWVNKIRDGRFDDIVPFRQDMLELGGWDLRVALEGLARFGDLH
ncbi:MAG: 12-oxophytodienoate reductase [Sphingomonas bacterium]|nr:12-oxophytodienoate reductase [Sphingomonas bacterium]